MMFRGGGGGWTTGNSRTIIGFVGCVSRDNAPWVRDNPGTSLDPRHYRDAGSMVNDHGM